MAHIGSRTNVAYLYDKNKPVCFPLPAIFSVELQRTPVPIRSKIPKIRTKNFRAFMMNIMIMLQSLLEFKYSHKCCVITTAGVTKWLDSTFLGKFPIFHCKRNCQNVLSINS